MRKLLPTALLLMATAAQAGEPVLQPFSARRDSGPVVVDTEMITSARDAGAASRDGIEGRVAGSLRLNESLRLGIGASIGHNTVSREDEIGNMPFMVKGVMTAEDAALCVEHGVQVVYISNHGGRQLDHVQGNIETLPEIVAAVDGKAEVVIDGGFTRGTDGI